MNKQFLVAVVWLAACSGGTNVDPEHVDLRKADHDLAQSSSIKALVTAAWVGFCFASASSHAFELGFRAILYA